MIITAAYAFIETAENGVYRGNRLNPSKKIRFTSYYGKKGVVYSIEDEGEGYDYREVIRKYIIGEKYYEGMGVGTEYQDKTKMIISFNQRGNAVYVMYLFGKSR